MDKLHIIDDIEIEYRKLYNECKKKYSTTREVRINFNIKYFI
jgi:hypothetical protein